MSGHESHVAGRVTTVKETTGACLALGLADITARIKGLRYYVLPGCYVCDVSLFHCSRPSMHDQNPNPNYITPNHMCGRSLLWRASTMGKKLRVLVTGTPRLHAAVAAATFSLTLFGSTMFPEYVEYSGTRVSGGPFPSHASWAMGPDLWLTPSTLQHSICCPLDK